MTQTGCSVVQLPVTSSHTTFKALSRRPSSILSVLNSDCPSTSTYAHSRGLLSELSAPTFLTAPIALRASCQPRDECQLRQSTSCPNYPPWFETRALCEPLSGLLTWLSWPDSQLWSLRGPSCWRVSPTRPINYTHQYTRQAAVPFATIADPKVSLASNYHASITARLKSQMRLFESNSWTCAVPSGMMAPCAVQALRYDPFTLSPAALLVGSMTLVSGCVY